MHDQLTPVKRALLSLSDKTGLVAFAKRLQALGIELVSTGGTAKALHEAGIAVVEVTELTHFPEMMDGRLKTLHPNIHGGILGQRDLHAAVAKEHDIGWIDLVVVNLYPFAATIAKSGVSFDEAVENIDIGGPTMIRAAAKNMGWVGVVVDPSDYESLATELETQHGLSFATRRQLATKAFAHTAEYDALIFAYLQPDIFPTQMSLSLKKFAELRYGENPHQQAAAYHTDQQSAGILTAEQLGGKQLSYNNIADADAALACVREFDQPACVIVKHANPCGVASAVAIETAVSLALAADRKSAFGGIAAMNRECSATIASELREIFMEVIIAPAFSAEALEILARKPNLRILKVEIEKGAAGHEFKHIAGGLLVQATDAKPLSVKDLKMVTDVKPSAAELQNLLFAWNVVKHVKSNAILVSKNQQTLGVGAGQVSRIDAVELALRKAGKELDGVVLASDAFFPFRDSIDRIAKNPGIRAIIQPGGSIKDAEVIAACNEHGIAMVFTEQRCFKH